MADINVEFSTPEIDINLSGGFTIDSTARTLAQDAYDKSVESETEVSEALGIEKMDNWSESGLYIRTVAPVDWQTTERTSYQLHCQAIACTAGDVFTYYGRGVSSSNIRSLCFIDANGEILNYKSLTSVTKGTITAPASSAYLIVNLYATVQGQYVYKGTLPKDDLEGMKARIDEQNENIFFNRVSLPFAENRYIKPSDGTYTSNSSYPYLYAEQIYQAISEDNPVFITMGDSTMKWRAHLYSEASQTTGFVLTTPLFNGADTVILNGTYEGTAYKYARFSFMMADQSYSTEIFNSLVAAFNFRRRNDRLNVRTGDSYQTHFNVTINATQPYELIDIGSDLNVNAVVMLPSSYTPTGTPTKAVFIHHGQSGTVTDTEWYKDKTEWLDLMSSLLSAGYAVFDVNGSGPAPASEADTDVEPYATYHRDYGCPNGLQAAYKAYEFLVKNYNIDRKIYVSGYSMGGATGFAFAKRYPNIVRAVGLISPAELRGSALSDEFESYVATNYGYTDAAEMEEDGYKNLWASSPSIEHFNSDGERQFMPYSYSWRADNTLKHFIDFPLPLKVWHGTRDTTTSPIYSEALVNGATENGSLAFFRPIETGVHALASIVDVIKAELPLWFARY